VGGRQPLRPESKFPTRATSRGHAVPFSRPTHPGAKTIVFALGPLAFKAEGLWYAYQISTRLLVMAGAITLLLQTTPPGDLMTALEQNGMPPGPAYVVVTSLQVIPETQARAAGIVAAQRARGLSTGGSICVERGPCCRWSPRSSSERCSWRASGRWR